MPNITLLLHNIRSTHNVGSIFRTAEGFGVDNIICSGYTPYPQLVNDTRLPHIARKLNDQIHKTALGAETLVPFEVHSEPPFVELKRAGYRIVALEQSSTSVNIRGYKPPEKLALLLGEEVEGVESANLTQCDQIIEIPMRGTKESFNVSVAAGIALYALCP